MTGSTTLRALAIVTVVLSSACKSESEPEPQKSSKSSRKQGSKSEARSSGGQSDPADSGAADGGDATVEDGADAQAADAAAATPESDAGAGRAESESGGSTSGAGETPAQTESGTTERGPYFESGAWHGYLWISHHADATTIAATNFSGPTFRERACIHGSVAATPDNSGNAMLGLNINQAHRPDAPTLTLEPTGAGIQLEVANAGASPLRIQVHAPDGATNGDARWCAMVNGSGGFIPWAQFNTACWDGSGKPYEREPISAALLLVPGNTEKPVPYDVCLIGLSEADTAP